VLAEWPERDVYGREAKDDERREMKDFIYLFVWPG